MILDRDNILHEQEELKQLNQQLQAQVAAPQNNSTRAEGEAENSGSLDLHVLDELIQKWIMEAKLPQHLISTTRFHDSPCFEDIQECELLKRFTTPIFDSYTGARNLVQHIHHFQEKMTFYSRNDPVICLTFLSNLRGATSEWLYTLPTGSLCNFLEITEPFRIHYAICQKT